MVLYHVSQAEALLPCASVWHIGARCHVPAIETRSGIIAQFSSFIGRKFTFGMKGCSSFQILCIQDTFSGKVFSRPEWCTGYT